VANRRVTPQESGLHQFGNLGVLRQALYVVGAGGRGPVSVAVDEAEEPERATIRRVELMKRAWSYVHTVEQPDVFYAIAENDASLAAYYDDRVRVLVPLQRRVSARLDLEVS
jgi:alpha-amylase/alpha-mannosidase (GH57 family)